MGCGVQGTNHLRKGEWGAKGAHPYCDKDQLGYMWDSETFERMKGEGTACLACIRTLERDALQNKLDELTIQLDK